MKKTMAPVEDKVFNNKENKQLAKYGLPDGLWKFNCDVSNEGVTHIENSKRILPAWERECTFESH